MLKHLTFIGVLIGALILAFFLLSGTAVGQSIMGGLKNTFSSLLEFAVAIFLVIVFFGLPVFTGSLARNKFVTWLDEQIDPKTPFAYWQVMLIGAALALIVGGFYPFLSQLASQNAQLSWFAAQVGPARIPLLSEVIAFFSASGWFWFGAGLFFISYVLGKKK